MKTFRVGTFFDEQRDPYFLGSYTAYTLWYNPTWKGCVEYKIEAKNGAAAKHEAICNRRRHELRLAQLRAEGAELIREVRASEKITGEDLAIRINSPGPSARRSDARKET